MAKRDPAAPMSEREWQRQVLDVAHMFGWWTYHTHDSRRSQPGFPDLVLVRAPRLIFAEIKTNAGKLSDEQAMVISMLNGTAAEAYVWRPEDMSAVLSLLSRDGNPVTPSPPRAGKAQPSRKPAKVAR